FIERDYIKSYGSQLVTGARYAILAALLLPLISMHLAFFVFAIFTMLHVIRQQSGIAKSLMRGGNRYHSLWEWAGVILSLVLYIDIYTSFNPAVAIWYIWAI